MDTELFELCKSVYEKFPNLVGLQSTILEYSDGYGVVNTSDLGSPSVGSGVYIAPLYTIEYLLEELPQAIYLPSGHGDARDKKMFGLSMETPVVNWSSNGTLWAYSYSNSQDVEYWSEANTPLKALLKLRLALVEAGELK